MAQLDEEARRCSPGCRLDILGVSAVCLQCTRAIVRFLQRAVVVGSRSRPTAVAMITMSRPSLLSRRPVARHTTPRPRRRRPSTVPADNSQEAYTRGSRLEEGRLNAAIDHFAGGGSAGRGNFHLGLAYDGPLTRRSR